MTTTNLDGSMDPNAEIAALRASAPAEIAAVTSIGELDEIEERVVGRRSPLAEAKRRLADVSPEDRPALGKALNEAAAELSETIAARRAELAVAAENEALAADRMDVTLPGRRPARGATHLVQQVMDEVVDIFVSLGYTVATGPEAETEFYNFTALNMPYTHPARLEQDTFYLDYGNAPEEVLLRTHTSPMQARYMEQHAPPVHIVVPGRVYRRDSDSTHTPVFHQIEGLAVDGDVTMADLKGTLAYFAREFFGPDTKVKFLPNHFPFTEPSAEMHAYADGRWLELLGCGMVNPAVFEHVGYDPDEVTGFAFGMGAERLAMVRYGIEDIRALYDADIRILEQYR